jgi:phosphoglycerate dehydrogenase-like enzyme
MPTIVTCFPIDHADIQRIRQTVGSEYELLVSDQPQIARDLFSADIFCGHAKVPVDWERVVAAGRLQWIQSSAAGLDHCLTPPVINSPILVSGCSGLFAIQVAEQTLALLLGLLRGLPTFFRQQQQRMYTRAATADLIQKRIGIVGLGGNGQRLAQVLRPLVRHIVATDLFLESCQPLLEAGVVDALYPNEELEKILPEIDVLIITLPLSPPNENRIDRRQLQLLPPQAVLINVGRGSVVNTDALVDSLSSGRLAAAGLDVVEPEPLPPESPLWQLPNVLLTPHVGAQSERRVPLTVDLFCENFQRYRQGRSLLNLVDKQLGFPRPEHRIPLTWPGQWM